MDAQVHRAAVRVPGRRRADHELSSPTHDAAAARRCVRGRRSAEARLRARHRRAVPVLLVRRRDDGGVAVTTGSAARPPTIAYHAAVSLQLDAESSRWVETLRGEPSVREAAVARLHTMLHSVARAEAYRRRGSLPADVAGDLDDLCLQAANDAVTAVVRKLDEFRGASRFTTWAYKFVVLEVSVRLRRRAWSTRRVDLDEASWGSLAGPAPSADRAIE